MAIGYLYTGGPYPIAYTPFGELFSGVFMGMLIVLIAFYIQTGEITTIALLLSIPSMLLVAAIMLSNNIRDIVGDKESGRKTMAILIGRKRAITVLLALFIVSYVWIVALVIMGVLTPWALLSYFKHKKTYSCNSYFQNKRTCIRSSASDERYCINKYNIRFPSWYWLTNWLFNLNL